jgi:hypothetical protein
MQTGTDLVLRSTLAVRKKAKSRLNSTGLELAFEEATGNDAGPAHRIKNSTNPRTDNGVPSSSKTGGRRLHLKRKIETAQSEDAT